MKPGFGCGLYLRGTLERAFCTIITRSHLHWALALEHSLRVHEPDLAFHILVTDLEGPSSLVPGRPPHTHLLSLADLVGAPLAADVQERYAGNRDALRWCMKPVLMMHLLKHCDQVIYGDCDLYFHGDHRFLWKELDHRSILLSPHWRSSQATVDKPNFDLLFVGGMFNAGFVGATRAGVPALLHWGRNCVAQCVKDFSKGQCDDQRYLELLPIHFEAVGILRHRGCNVANWNRVECRREKQVDGSVLINGTDPVVFVHYTRSTIHGILKGEDPELLPHLEAIRDLLLRFAPGEDIIARHLHAIAEQQRRKRPSPRARMVHKVKSLLGGNA